MNEVGRSHHDPETRQQAAVDLARQARATKHGDCFAAFYCQDDDEIILKRMKRRRSNWLEVLKQCPTSMDDIPPRSRELPKKRKL